MATPRMRLRFERSGRVVDVAEFRADGWPICPCCNDHELTAVDGLSGCFKPEDIDLCNRCGPVEVVSHDDGNPADELPFEAA